MDIKEIMKFDEELNNCVFDTGIDNSEKMYYKKISVAYLLFNVKRCNINNIASYSISKLCEQLNNEDIRNFVYEMCSNIEINKLVKLNSTDINIVKEYILSTVGNNTDYFRNTLETSTPQSINNLVIRLLNIKEQDKVLDNCCGIGSFLCMAYIRQPKAEYYGVEINSWVANIAKIKMDVMGKDNVVLGNALENKFNFMFDKAFSNHPFGLQLKYLNIDNDIFESYKKTCPAFTKGTSADWIFNYKLSSLIKEDGKAVAIMTNGGLWNTLDRQAREFFIKEGKIEAIISLPAKLFENTAIPVSLIVFGKNKGTIKFIDASKEFVDNRRINVLSDDNICKILYAMDNDCEISKTVSVDEVINQNFNFDPKQYLTVKPVIKNGIDFSSVIKRITRGAPISASELDEMISKVPTDYQYLMLANIHNGLIDNELPYLKSIPENYEKYCIKTGNLIISKNGYPFKIAVADIPNGANILANGNLFVIELDTEKVDPYFVKAFLESEQGILELKNIVVGSTIPNIGVAQLNTIQIPMLEMEKQKEISNKYLALIDEIKYLKGQIEKNENSLSTVFSSLSVEDK